MAFVCVCVVKLIAFGHSECGHFEVRRSMGAEAASPPSRERTRRAGGRAASAREPDPRRAGAAAAAVALSPVIADKQAPSTGIGMQFLSFYVHFLNSLSVVQKRYKLVM